LNGSIETEKTFCASVASCLDMMVIHPCPRLVHEAKHPTAHHDACDSMDWILENAKSLGGDLSKLVISGVSSGGNLAATVTQQLSTSGKCDGNVRLRGQVLIIPWLVQPAVFPSHLFADKDKTSLIQCSNSLGLPTERLKWLSDNLEAGDISDVLINPALAEDKVLVKLPKTAIIVGGGDPLRDDGLLYATRLKDGGCVSYSSPPSPAQK
jgi:acetyl esterase/lipase